MSNTSVDAFRDWASQTSVRDVIPKRDLVKIRSDATLTQVLAALKENHIHSLPVVSKGHGHVLGMVDVLDVVCSVYEYAELSRFNKGGVFHPGDVAAALMDVTPLKKRFDEATADAMVRKAAPPVSSVIARLPASFEGPQIPIRHVLIEDCLLTLMKKLGWDARHRVPVVASVEGAGINDVPTDHSNESASQAPPSASIGSVSEESSHLEMVDVISQADLMRFLYKNREHLPAPINDIKLKDICSKTLCKVGYHASMAEVLWLFRQHKVLSIVVEDHSNGFVAPLSAVDFINRASNLEIYGMAVDEFLASAPKEAGVPAPIIVSPNTTVLEAMKMLSESKQYRLWLSNGDVAHSGRPIVNSIVSNRDLLLAVWQCLPENQRKADCED